MADELKDIVNVAKVDVMSNRDLGTRFEIEGSFQIFVIVCGDALCFAFALTGFPTLKLLSHGKVYTFRGRRSKDEIVEVGVLCFDLFF